MKIIKKNAHKRIYWVTQDDPRVTQDGPRLTKNYHRVTQDDPKVCSPSASGMQVTGPAKKVLIGLSYKTYTDMFSIQCP